MSHLTQLELPLLCRLDAPSVVPPQHLRGVTSYRQAVLVCWSLRRDRSAGAQSACARHIGSPVSHMSAYLSDDENERDMPAKRVRAFEAWCGNTAISQWIAMGASLTVLEEMQALKVAA